MKSTSLKVCLFLLPLSAFAQGAPVNLSNGDPLTYYTLVQNANASVDNLIHAVRVVQNGIDAATAQAKMVESLGQGDWSGFMDAFSHQIDAIDSTTEAIDTYNQYYDKEEKNKDLVSLSDTLKSTSTAMKMQRNILQSTTNLLNNTKERFSMSMDLASKSANSQSLVQQLQIAGQQTSLLQQELGDVKTVLYYNMVYAQSLEDQRIKEANAARRESVRNMDKTNAYQLFTPADPHRVF